MKKSTKIVLITAAVLAAVGMILILIGVALGGNKQYREYVRENGEVSVVLFPHSLKLRLSAGTDGLNINVVSDDADWEVYNCCRRIFFITAFYQLAFQLFQKSCT